jgi:hypothetical protein
MPAHSTVQLATWQGNLPLLLFKVTRYLPGILFGWTYMCAIQHFILQGVPVPVTWPVHVSCARCICKWQEPACQSLLRL